MSDSVRPHRWQPTRLPHPSDSLGKNTGVGCHFLLQCMKVKSESEVAQSCLTLHDPMDCSPPGSSTHEIFQARVLEWGAIAFSAPLLQGKPIPKELNSFGVTESWGARGERRSLFFPPGLLSYLLRVQVAASDHTANSALSCSSRLLPSPPGSPPRCPRSGGACSLLLPPQAHLGSCQFLAPLTFPHPHS